MRAMRAGAVVAALALMGCGRIDFQLRDAGGSEDASVDAGEGDGGSDAGSADGGPDASAADAGLDAGPPPMEVCNGLDDDLDGSIDESAGCPCPVMQFDGHAYMICTATGVPWTTARDTCAASGYHLAKVETDAENVFIASVIPGQTWLGHSDRATEGTWIWLDGTALAFTAWAFDQPDSGVPAEDCGTMRPDALWYDRECFFDFPYVCEAP